jgi:predicted lipoprotein
MTNPNDSPPEWAMQKADEIWAEIHAHKIMPFSKEKIIARALTAVEAERNQARVDRDKWQKAANLYSDQLTAAKAENERLSAIIANIEKYYPAQVERSTRNALGGDNG